jgi:hypothetical protein
MKELPLNFNSNSFISHSSALILSGVPHDIK